MLDVGEPEPDDIRVVMEMRKPGGPNNQPLISDETARNKIGIDDAEAEKKRIEEEAPEPGEDGPGKSVNVAYKLRDVQGMSPDTMVQVSMNKKNSPTNDELVQ